MILPEVAARINKDYHVSRCVCKGTFDERCRAGRVAPAGVSGVGRALASEVPAGVI